MVGVIDIGSNTIRLVIYSVEDGQIRSMLNKKYSAGLAGYIDKSKTLNKKGVEKLIDILSEIRSILRDINIKKVYPFATASLRNSSNGREVISLIKKKCGFDVRILTGEEEATFDYYGVVEEGISESGLLVDVGGGSTELTFFKDRKIVAAKSMPIGSLNLYKRFVDGLLPMESEAKEIKKEVKANLQMITLPKGELITQPIYSVGGTARAVQKLMNEKYGWPDYTKQYTHSELKHLLLDMEGRQKRLMQDILSSSPERIHTIIPGMIIFETVAKYFNSRTFITSSYGVREGYLMHVLKESESISEQKAI